MKLNEHSKELQAEQEGIIRKHNSLIAQYEELEHLKVKLIIIEEFAPSFAENSECLYVGDTIQKDLVKNEEKLRELSFEITLHDKMPDVVL